jgi:hypothetical protein
MLSGLPTDIQNNLNIQYRLSDGSTSTYQDDFNSNLGFIIDNPSYSATTVAFYGAVPSTTYWGLVSQYSKQLNVFGSSSNNLDNNDLSADLNDPWYYATFDNDANINNDYAGYSFYYTVTSLTTTDGGATYTGTIEGDVFNFSGTAYSEYNNMVVATLRSRGISLYSNNADLNEHGPVYEVSGLTDVALIATGQYSGITNSPYEGFLLSGITKNSQTFQFETSMDESNSNYITKVFGIGNFDKSRTDYPIFVEERYSSMLRWAYNKGYIRGINCNLLALPPTFLYIAKKPSSVLVPFFKPRATSLTPYISAIFSYLAIVLLIY